MSLNIASSKPDLTAHFASPKPFSLAVKAVIVDASGRCLLVRRSSANKHFAGCWEWPGGKVDSGEDFASAVIRETKEETGLDVNIVGLAGAVSFEMTKVNVVLLCMEVRITGGALILSEEHDAAEWVPLKELGCWELPPQHKAFMEKYGSTAGAMNPLA